jgi:hypothetical protein
MARDGARSESGGASARRFVEDNRTGQEGIEHRRRTVRFWLQRRLGMATSSKIATESEQENVAAFGGLCGSEPDDAEI